ncbi:MAG: IS200/IS605 family transposase [Candidatus Omnitrophica bacterium]|nr:IS200/IS605 family transposase [Candidatus Omnitrophota bacterium]
MKYSRQEHAVYYTRYHIVICARYRRKVLRGAMGEYAKLCVKEISRRYPEILIDEVNTYEDDMHLLISIPPKMAVSWVVNVLKSNTGRLMREKFAFLSKLYPRKDGLWSTGYFVSTVGADEQAVRRHIESQGREDRGQAQLEF